MEKNESKTDAINNTNNNNNTSQNRNEIPYRPTKISEFLKAKKNANFNIDFSSLSEKTFTSLIGDTKKYNSKQKEEEIKTSKNPESQKKIGNTDIKIPDNERKRKHRLRTNDVKLPSNISLLKRLCEKININEKENTPSIFKFDEDDNNNNNNNNNINNNNNNNIDDNTVKKKLSDEFNKKEVLTHKKTNSQNLYNPKESNKENNIELDANHKKQNVKRKKEINPEYEHLTYADSKITNPKYQNKLQNNNYNKNQNIIKNNNNPFVENEIIKNNYFIKLKIMGIEFSFMENINIQFETTMEDRSKSIVNFNNNPNEILLQIFDGHGGGNVSSYLQKNFSKMYQQYLNETQNNIGKSLSLSFTQIDEEIRKLSQIENQGSTGTIIHIIRDKNNRLFVYNGNVGDSRASLISSKKIIRLSKDHRTSDKEERKRIIAEGGMILNNRVNGELMLTRSFGDFDFKHKGNNNTSKKNDDELSRFRKGVICEPFVTQIEIDQSINNQFLFIASDGVWDVISEEELQQLIKVNNDTQYLSSIIIEKALFKNAWDNLSIFVVKLT